jgi:MFS family permease
MKNKDFIAKIKTAGKGYQADRTVLAAFFTTAVLGALLGWSARDLVWGLLLTSFLTCILGFILGIQSGFRLWIPKVFRHWPDSRAGTLVVLLFGVFMAGIILTAFAVSIIMLHIFYAFAIYFLYPMFPAIPTPFELSSDEQFQMLRNIFTDYWFFTLIAIFSDWKRQFQPLWKPAHLDIARPMKRLGRMHLFIILAIAVTGVAGTGLAFYWLTLFFFFFPWNTLGNRRIEKPMNG